jgi:hypothetical protein
VPVRSNTCSQAGLSAVFLPAIRPLELFSAIAHGCPTTDGPRRFSLCFRGVPGAVFNVRTGVALSGLGPGLGCPYTHQVWLAHPSHIHNSLLPGPSSFRISALPPPAGPPPELPPRFLPTAGLKSKHGARAISAKNSGSPTAHGPVPSFGPSIYRPPPWWWLALRHLALFRPHQPIIAPPPVIYPLMYCIWLYPPLPPVHLSTWPSYYLIQFVYLWIRTSVWCLQSLSPIKSR